MEYLEVKRQIREKISTPIDFHDSQNLLELGLNSLQIMRLINQWRKQGVRVSFGELMEEPVFSKWWILLQAGKKHKKERVKKDKQKILKTKVPFPLTDVQYAYWIGRSEDQVLGDIGCHAYLEFDGKHVDTEKLVQAWNILQYHHPMLRARFLPDGKQEIMEQPYSERVTIHDLRTEIGKTKEIRLEEIRGQLSHRKLKIEEGQVAGLEISLLPNEKTRVHVDLDLLVADVQSLQILLRDLSIAYEGKPLQEESKNFNFAAYLEKQSKEEQEEFEEARTYWKERLELLPEGPKLPLLKRPEEVKHTKFKRRLIQIKKREWDHLQKRAADYRTTPAMVLLTAYVMVLERWSTEKHFLINIPLFNRKTEYKGLEEVIADFTTLLLLEVDGRNVPTFLQLLEGIQKQMHSDMKYTMYSGVQVQRDLARLQGGRQNVAPIVFACNLGEPLINESFETTIGAFTYMISQTPQVWLDFQSYEDENGLMLAWDTVDELFPPQMIEEMLQSFETLLHRLEQEEWGTIFDVLPEKQMEFIKKDSRILELDRPQCLHTAFLEYAKTHTDAIAIVDTGANISLTYGTLYEKALSVSAAIANKGIYGEPIAITIPRNYNQIVAALGILISGNCYAPVSIEQPEARRRAIHKKMEIHYAITEGEVNVIWPDGIEIWKIEELICVEKQEHTPDIDPEHTAYIIMTSGSTGMPKGVEIAHDSAWNTIVTVSDQYQINEKDTIMCISAMDFDLSVYDVFGTLGCGGKLVVIPEEEKRNAEYWLLQIQKYNVTIWNSVPVLLDMLLVSAEMKAEQLPFRTVLLSGDWIGLDLPERLEKKTKHCIFVSLGGATEASIWSNHQEVITPIPKEWKSIPYGRPLKNQAYRVVDNYGRDCPFWVEGELWIGGCGVARGYKGDLELTKNKFVKDALGRWYRTGDNGRFWSDRTIEFMGRQDNQVKIRGHRIELGEIEYALNQCTGIKRGVVEQTGEIKGDKFLVAYVEAEEHSSIFTKEMEEGIEIDPAWNGILEILDQSERDERLQSEFEQYIIYANENSKDMMLNTLQGLSLFQNREEPVTIDDIIKKGGMEHSKRELVLRWLKILIKAGYLREEEGYYSLVEEQVKKMDVTPQNTENLDEFCETLKSHMPMLLTGKESAIEVFYQEDQKLSPKVLLNMIPGHQENKHLFETCCKEIVKRSDWNDPIRILEIGTRDIEVTRNILQGFQGVSMEYTYADNSRFFLDDVKNGISNSSKIHFEVLNLDLNVEEQGYQLHSYDCVIAVHSLHRFRNMNHVLEQIGKLMVPSGILMMTELTRYTNLQEITASFLEDGFKYVNDERKQMGNEILKEDIWKEKLLEHGFVEVALHPELYGRSILVSKFKNEIPILSQISIKDQLSQMLPEYMIPKVFYLIDYFPMNSNGKVDRKALHTRYSKEMLPLESKQAKTEFEHKLLKIWKQIFQIEELGVTDNYFTLGGDSLIATRLLSVIGKEFTSKVSIGLIFEKPTIRELAAAMESLNKKDAVQELPAISPEPEKENLPFPLTDVQYAYWIGRSGFYSLGNVSTHCYFELDTENLDRDRLQRSWNDLIRNHGMMRGIIRSDGQQMILKEVPNYQIKVQNLEGLLEKERENALKEIREQMSHQVLESSQWPLFDVQMSIREPKKERLHISFDNLIFDGWSMFFILSEWAKQYRFEKEAVPLQLSFRDYVLGLEQIKNSPIYTEDKRYWLDRIQDLSPAPQLPLAKKESNLEVQRFQRRSGQLKAEEWTCLREKAKEIGITPSILLIAAYGEVLRMWSASPDFTINLTQFDRKPLHPEVEALVGDFTTLTLLEIVLKTNSSFEERAKEIQHQLMKDLDHSFYSAVEVERELKKVAGNVQSAIMPIVFTSGLGISQWEQGKWLGDLVYNISQTPQVWLDHQVIEKDGELCLFWDSVDELFNHGMLDEMFLAYTDLLKNLAHNPELFMKRTDSLVNGVISEEREKANQTGCECDGIALDAMFLEAAALWGNKEAVVTPSRRMTYQEIREEAFYICRQLQSRNLEKEETVAIIMEKGWEQMVAVYGVLFAGGAYLPIDPQNPPERIQSILESSGTRFLLIQGKILENAPWLSERDCIEVVKGNKDLDVPLTRNDPSSLAYVIYTSGTTGVPKGVMITHSGAMNTIYDINRRYQITERDKILGLSNLHFDLSVYDIFGILGVGGTLVLPDSRKTKDPAHWVELMNQEKISLWNSVPAFMEMLMEYEQFQGNLCGENLRIVLLSGDWIPISLPAKIRSHFQQVRMIALGGATEASIWSNGFEIPQEIPMEWNSIPYGKPLANQSYYILNTRMQNCPDWVPGMLYIAGEGLAKGYLNDECLSDEKFIYHSTIGERLYCTGDIGRYWEDGTIEFLGRRDNQIKRNGYRIELGEIQNAIFNIDGVRDGIVVTEQLGGEDRLILAILKTNQLKENEIYDQLKRRLPKYMMPDRILFFETYPLSSNGKLDRNRIVDQSRERNAIEKSKAKMVMPESQNQKNIYEIWKEILASEELSITDDFFDCGGNSLQAIKLVNRLSAHYNVEITIEMVFENPSILELSAQIEEIVVGVK